MDFFSSIVLLNNPPPQKKICFRSIPSRDTISQQESIRYLKTDKLLLVMQDNYFWNKNIYHETKTVHNVVHNVPLYCFFSSFRNSPRFCFSLF